MHICMACTCSTAMHARARQRCTRTHVSGTIGMSHVLGACTVRTCTFARHAHLHLRCTYAHASDARARTSVARAACHMCSTPASWLAQVRLLNMRMCDCDACTRTPGMHAHARQRLERRTTCDLCVRRGMRIASACMHMCTCDACTRTHVSGSHTVPHALYVCVVARAWRLPACTCATAKHARARTLVEQGE